MTADPFQKARMTAAPSSTFPPLSMPLTLTQWGISLRRVQSADIETMRQGRNKDFVRLRHRHQEIITEAQQRKWFESVNTKDHYYFVIHVRGQDQGVVFIKDYKDGLARCGCGVFMWDEAALGSRTPILAVLSALDFFFYRLGSGFTETFVLKDNSPAIRMDRFFGFSFEDVPDTDQMRVTMTHETFMEQRPRLIAFAKRMVKTKENHELVVTGALSDKNFDEINAMLGNEGEARFSA